MSAFERIPVSGKNLLEDASSPQRVLPPPGCTWLGYWHVYGKAILPRLTNAVHPSSGCPGGPSTSFILKRWGLPGCLFVDGSRQTGCGMWSVLIEEQLYSAPG